MKQKITIVLLVLVSFLLQCTVFRWLEFNGIVPNVLVILVASMGLMEGKKCGLFTGFLAGFLVDLFFGEVLGFYALLYLYIGYISGLFRQLFYPKDIKLPLALVLLSDILFSFFSYVLLFLLRGRFHFGYYLLHICMPEMVYTIAVTFILYPFYLWVNTRMRTEEQRSA